MNDPSGDRDITPSESTASTRQESGPEFSSPGSREQNLQTAQALDPTGVWKIFAELSSIPRCSGHEQAAVAYVERFAEERGLECFRDKIGNVVVRAPATPGYEGAPGTVMQGHLDMVCEKENGIDHDFSTDPVALRRDGDWLRAEGTTLGADNGIAVALALAALSDESLRHGPLEALFTVDEETGLTGATALTPGMVSGRILLNLDSEEEGVFCIGCAGGKLTGGTVGIDRQPLSAGIDAAGTGASGSRHPESEYTQVLLRITGLKGGHSGAEIHEQRGNAVGLIVRLLDILIRLGGIRLVSLNGGSKHNAIPRECEARLRVPTPLLDDVTKTVHEYARTITEELAAIEPEVRCTLTRISIEGAASDPAMAETPPPMTDACAMGLIRTLRTIPHGVLRMSDEMPGLVETSTNLAVVTTKHDTVEILTSQRSSRNSGRDDASQMVRCSLEGIGAQVTFKSEYPAWPPDPASPLLRLMLDTYRRVMGSEAEAKAIHAGLECAVIGAKFEGMRMISLGPDILDAHTPRERVSIPSTGRTWSFLRAALERIGRLDTGWERLGDGRESRSGS
jgi:dipeptidase D